ncbi:MAG: sigma 54-interacting transcriptional regulator [Parabacteroides distasonis]
MPKTKAGTFERANGGHCFSTKWRTSLDAQVKLLRVLEERKITRIGGKKAIPVDVRIVAATNRNLDDSKGGHFRLDLLYRLNVFTLILPRSGKGKIFPCWLISLYGSTTRR